MTESKVPYPTVVLQQMMAAANILALLALLLLPALCLQGLYASLQYLHSFIILKYSLRLHHLPKSGSEAPYRSPHKSSTYEWAS